MLIAQLTDPHVSAQGAPPDNRGLRAALAKLAVMRPRPDVLLITGDLTIGGTVAEYDRLAEILAQLPIPVFVTIGNHDVRASFVAHPAFADSCDVNGFVQQAIEHFPVRILMLDSTSDTHHQGQFCPQRLAWLVDRLEEQPRRPTLLAFHHPPFRTGIVAMDGAGAEWADGLCMQLSRHRQIVGIICGHLHRSIHALVEGIPVSVCPSPVSQVALDLDPSSSLERHLREGFGVAEPGAFQLHLWTGEQLVTHTAFIEDFARSQGVIVSEHPEMSTGRYQGKWMVNAPAVQPDARE